MKTWKVRKVRNYRTAKRLMIECKKKTLVRHPVFAECPKIRQVVRELDTSLSSSGPYQEISGG